MPSKPTVGGSRNSWGTVLNDYLAVAIEDDGELRPEKVEAAYALAGGPTEPEWLAEKTKIARVDAGVDAGATDNVYLASIQGVRSWQKRRYVLAEADHKSGSTVNVQAALTAGSGRDVVFDHDPALTYLVPDAGLTLPSNTHVYARGSRAAQLTAPATATGTTMMRIAASTGLVIEGLDLNCNDHATMKRAISLETTGADRRDVRLSDVTVRNALELGWYSWNSTGLTLERFRVFNSVTAMQFFDIKGDVRLIRPFIKNDIAGRMRRGILLSTASGSPPAYPEGLVTIDTPWIEGADFATTTGAEAHGITAFRSSYGMMILNPTISRCGNPANGLGGGIVFSGQSHWAQLEGGMLRDNYAAGLWTEVMPSGDVTLGTDTSERGVSVRGTRLVRNAVGASSSYGAGTTFVDVWAIENKREGFVTDAEAVVYSACRAINNWTDVSAPDPIQNGGARAGFRAYSVVAFRNEYAGGYHGCMSYDNRTVKLQEYGFAADDRAYRFVGNQGEGSLGAYSGGATNNIFSGNNW